MVMAKVSISYEGLGANICRLREERGMSVEELARKAGATENYVLKAEAGKRRITLYAAMCFCDALGVSPNELFDNILESK